LMTRPTSRVWVHTIAPRVADWSDRDAARPD
jgi:hypothetical protein